MYNKNRDRRYTRDFLDIFKHLPPYVIDQAFTNFENDRDMVTVEYEHILGKRFVNANGEMVIIGIAQDVQEALGLPFEVMENHNREIDVLHARTNHLRNVNSIHERANKEIGNRLLEFRRMPFHKRLWFLLTKRT